MPFSAKRAAIRWLAVWPATSLSRQRKTSSTQFVVCTHFRSLTGWRQLLQEKVPQVVKKPSHLLSHQLLPKIIQVEQIILGVDVPLLR